MRAGAALDGFETQGAVAAEVETEDGAGRIFSGVCATLDDAGIPYAILHGYEDYPQRIASDIDAVIGGVDPRALCALLTRNRERIGADVVRQGGALFVLAGRSASGALGALSLDLTHDVSLGGVPFYRGREVLARRRRFRSFWIPAADIGFGSYLARTIAKARLDEARAQRLSRLYAENAEGGRRQVARFFGRSSAAVIAAAAASGDWAPVQQQIGRLQKELRRRAILKTPWTYLGNKIAVHAERFGRLLRPDGLSVAFLGPDGAGKSSQIEALGPQLGGVFDRVAYKGFAPPVWQIFARPGTRSTNRPHGLPSRSYATSLLRGAFWLAYYTLSRVSLRLDLARSSLVLYDRHFVDILVDPKRYRYGGPNWLLHLIWRLSPKPDLVVLLDAPAEVLQARKQEVPLAETMRQRQLYLSLLRGMKNGRIVDANRPRPQVTDAVTDLISHTLAARFARPGE
jgi:thymidylate kinase